MSIEQGFITHNDCEITSAGTWLQGFIKCDYSILVQTFGKPFKYSSEDIYSERWLIVFKNEILTTIYHCKDEGEADDFLACWRF